MLKERDDLAGTKGTSIETAEASYRIRIALRTVREDAQKLQDLQAKQERKVGLFTSRQRRIRDGGLTLVNCAMLSAQAGKRGDQEQIELSQRRREIVELAWKHIEECEGLEKRRFGEKSGGDRLMLLSGGSVGGGRQGCAQSYPTGARVDHDPAVAQICGTGRRISTLTF